MNQNKDLKPRINMLTNNIPFYQKRDVRQITESIKDQNYLSNVNVDKVYGFRYNQMADDQQDPWRNDTDSLKSAQRAVRPKHRQKYKGNGTIKLLNGMPLSLDDEPVNMFCDLLKGYPKERALKHQELVQ